MADDPPEELAPTPEVGYTCVNTELILPLEITLSKGRVNGRKRDAGGQVCGQANNNPILGIRTYLVQFDDGKVTELTANVIDAQMYAQCDPYGNMYIMLDDFTDHRNLSKDLYIEDQKATDSRGCNVMRRSTLGWKMCCQWKDGSKFCKSFVTLKNLTQ